MAVDSFPNENCDYKNFKGYHSEVEGDNLSGYWKKGVDFRVGFC
jgi:hypothetical protein